LAVEVITSPDENQLNTPLRPNAERPLSPEEMEEIEAASAGLPVLNVYKAARASSIRGGLSGRRGDPPTEARASCWVLGIGY